jgi:hypothetical protein
MSTHEILEAIDKQITQLQQARALLSSAAPDAPAVAATTKPSGKRRGRPKGSVNKKSEATAPAPARKVRATISAEGKARIAAAQKARWAVLKKSSNVAKSAAKKNSTKQSKKTVTPGKKAAAKRAPAVKAVATTKEA